MNLATTPGRTPDGCLRYLRSDARTGLGRALCDFDFVTNGEHVERYAVKNFARDDGFANVAKRDGREVNFYGAANTTAVLDRNYLVGLPGVAFYRCKQGNNVGATGGRDNN